MDKDKHFYLYVLRLENQKWYVGITTQTPEQRFKQHVNKWGSYWTTEYPPIEIHHTQDLGYTQEKRALTYESRVTRRYMKRYGLNNVRGGDLTDVVKYHKFLGRIYTQFEWEALSVVTLMLVGTIIEAVAYITKK